MCGIAGLLLPPGTRRRPDEAVLVRMRDVLRHRGPDEFGLFVDEGVGLVHRRLSIVDLSTGQQPMGNEDDSLLITYNGEIYNHAEYRQSLEAFGHQYRSHSDTEAILHLFEQYGPDVVHRLRGMFAFAIWNRRTRELFAARDRLGIKPLYYVHGEDGSLAFASEIKALVEAGVVKPAVNMRALPEFLANHATCGDDTLLSGVRRLLPGHTLQWHDGRLDLRKYWDVPASTGPAEARAADERLVDEWRELLRTSVRLRLMADVPLGMFLSGGIDSSAIAALMSGMVREPIKTFSVAFAEREANELEYARTVAAEFKTDHHEVIVSPDQFFEALPTLIWHEDEPLAHPSSVPLYFVSQLASRYVKVVLTGEGSDELLAGYYRYRATVLNLAAGRWYERATPASLRRAIAGAARACPEPVARKLRRTFLCLPANIESLYFDNFAVFPAAIQPGLLTARARAQVMDGTPHGAFRARFDAAPAATLLGRLLYADLKTYLHELLMKQDQMSMAASIESRVPFLDHVLVEFTTGLPEHLKLRGWTTKYILRRSMRGVLPESILNRPKMGFPVPVGRWLRTSHRHLVDEFVLGDRALAREIFEPAFVRALVAEHDAGRGNHAERLWALLTFEMWMRRVVEGDVRDTALPDVPEAPRWAAAA